MLDESAFLGLGAAAASGLLGPATRRALIERLVADRARARELGAEMVTFIGTEPLRRASDAARVVDEVERATGLPLPVLDYAEEGLLNLIGVTGGRPERRAIVVADVGGGSCEIVVAGRRRRPKAVGLQIGSSALTNRHVSHDPLMAAEIASMRDDARSVLGALAPEQPDEVVVVGGSASNVARVTPSAGALSDTGADGASRAEILTRSHLDEALAELRRLTIPEIVAAYTVRPERARVLGAGIVILEAILERYARDQLRVSHAGIREGLALVTARAGRSWRDELPTLALGWDA